ncbi:MAG: ABC transporter ATP-binding protein [Alphaproteobacteria bacterium]|nr:ABC transporter ATP-binding protein [Alphaproteobacteria bacterium]
MLEISGLHAGYGTSMVLHGVSMTIPRGTVTALMGRNGMGKTTLCRTLMGLVAPASGSIRHDEAEIAGLPPHRVAARGIAYVPQGRGIFERFTVQENLELGVAPWGGRVPAHVYRWFPLLADMRRRTAGTLSGGEQQTLALARALAANPTTLILDEPSEGLQPSLVEEMATLLLRIVGERRMTLFLVEQNLALVRRTATIVAFLVDGVIAGGAAARELAANSPLIHRHLGL